jgi:hypothetical protein
MKGRSTPSFLAVCLAILAAALIIISAVLVEPAQGTHHNKIKLLLATIITSILS